MARKSLDIWVHEALTENRESGKCSVLVLSHMIGMGRTEIHTHKVAAGNDSKSLAAMFQGKADAYCQDMRGHNQFVLDAYYSTKEIGATQPFTRAGQADLHSGLNSHPPTEEGRIMAKMERESDLVGQVYRRQERQDAREDRMAERMEKQVVHLMEENFKFFNMVKDLMVTATLDKDKRDMEKLAYARATQREKKIMDAIPVLTNMATGREIFPQSTVDTTIIESIARRLTPETLGMLGMLGLSEEEMGLITHRFNQLKDKEIRENEERKALPQFSGTGEEDIGGGTH